MSVKFSFEPPVIAHRGASSLAPENTLAAFQAAKKSGANWVEFDVMLTSDYEAVVVHDETLERTTTGRGWVADHPYSYLQMLDAGSWFDPKFKNEKIPTLRAVIALLNELQLSANVEIKAQIGKEEITAKKVLQVIAECWQQSSPPLISSFSLPILQSVRALSPESVMGLLLDEWREDWLLLCEQLQCCSVNVNHALLTLEKARAIKESGRWLLAYTVNDLHRASELFSWGVDAVFADFMFFK